LAVALLNYCDDEGYFLANPALIRGECFPFDEDSVSIHGGLTELSRIGYARLGTTPEGQRIGLVCNFLEHQQINRASPSKLKEKTIVWDSITESSLSVHGVLSAGSGSGSGSGRGSVRGESPAVSPPAGFLAFWNVYPSRRRVGRAKCLAVWVKQRLEAKAAAICLHVEAMKLTPDWQKSDGQFIPTSQTYLNQGRFDDGAPEPPEKRLSI
jgi:hypothetical protein